MVHMQQNIVSSWHIQILKLNKKIKNFVHIQKKKTVVNAPTIVLLWYTHKKTR